MRRFHCQLNSALRQPSPAPPANRLVYTSNNAGDWPTKAVNNNTHRMEIVNDIYKKLHDLDYFLLRYGPKDVAKYVEDDSTVSKYYGTLPFY